MQRATSIIAAGVILGAVLYVAAHTVMGFLDCLETGNWPTTGEHGPENKDYQWMQEAQQ